MATQQDPVMRGRIDEVVQEALAGGGDGLLLPALHAVQAALGHVPPAAVEVLADRFNVSRADVHGVITFYRDFTTSPDGGIRVRVCRGEACQAVGANGLAERLRATVDDGVGEVFCLGNCSLGPSVSVDGRVVGRATVDRVRGALAGGGAWAGRGAWAGGGAWAGRGALS